LLFALSVDPENTKLQERSLSVKETRSAGESTLPSTIGMELETNPFIRVSSAEEITSRRELKNTGVYRE
jgi:hydroxyacylglutathione hydrolase